MKTNGDKKEWMEIWLVQDFMGFDMKVVICQAPDLDYHPSIIIRLFLSMKRIKDILILVQKKDILILNP